MAQKKIHKYFVLLIKIKNLIINEHAEEIKNRLINISFINSKFYFYWKG